MREEQFKITDIFNVKNSRNILKSDVDFSKPKHPYATAQEANNSIMAYVDYDESALEKGNCLFIGGKTLTVTYQKKDFFSNDSHNLLLYLKSEQSPADEIWLYLATSVYKALKPKYNWNGSVSFKKIQNDAFVLPIQTDSAGSPIIDPDCTWHPAGYVPDWQYMEGRITELEQERITELEQYLIATGLNDYELTDEDKAVLSLSRKTASEKTGSHADADGKRGEEFLISDVFDIYKGKRLTKVNQIKGNTPYIGSTDSNNGVTGYIGQKPLFDGNVISVSYNGSVGQAFYQEQPFWASDDINVLILRKHDLTSKLYGYLGATLKKAGTQFSYSYKWNTERMKATTIHLPIQIDSAGNPIIDSAHTYHPDGYIPDWEFMEKYIRAVEKLVIADVVKWKDEEITRTKEIVDKGA